MVIPRPDQAYPSYTETRPGIPKLYRDPTRHTQVIPRPDQAYPSYTETRPGIPKLYRDPTRHTQVIPRPDQAYPSPAEFLFIVNGAGTFRSELGTDCSHYTTHKPVSSLTLLPFPRQLYTTISQLAMVMNPDLQYNECNQ